MNSCADRVSATDVTFPTAPAAAVQPAPVASAPRPLDIDLVLGSIRAMLDGCRTADRNELLVIAVVALIGEGVDTGPRIVGAARRLGFQAAHAGAVLRAGERGRARWRRGADGVYAVLA